MATIAVQGINGDIPMPDSFLNLPEDQQQAIIRDLIVQDHAVRNGIAPPPLPGAPDGKVRYNLPGVGQVDLDDSFGSLPPDQQHALLQDVRGQIVGTRPAPGSPEAPSGSLLDAAGQSIVHGLPAAIVSGFAGANRYINQHLFSIPGDGQLNSDADSFAARQRLAMARNYQRPDSVAPSIVAGLAEGQGLGDKLAKAGEAALYGAAENLGPMAGSLVALPAAAAAGPVAGLATGIAVGMPLAMDSVRQAKAKAGLDPDQVGNLDMLNTAGQTALNMIPGGSGIVPKAIMGAIKGAAAPVLNDAGAVAQGGTMDPRTILSDAIDGGVEGALVTGATHAAMGAGGALGEYAGAVRAAGKAGAPMRAFAAETGAWNDAVQKASEAAQAANPEADPDQIKSQAYQAAQQAGVTPPTYDTLSPAAQQGMAELAALQLYQARRAAETTGMGRSDTDMTPGRTFKGVMDDVAGALRDNADSLVSSGMLTKDQAAPLYDAVSEAAKHNRQAAQGGQDFGGFATARDQVAALPLDPAIKNQVLAQLHVLDIATANSLESRSRGPLETIARTLPIAGVAAGAIAAPLAGLDIPGAGEAIGAVAGSLARAQGINAARQADGALGWRQPDILRRQSAIENFAARNGLSPVADPMALQAMTADLQNLGRQVPLGPQVDPPVTTAGRGYVGMPSNAMAPAVEAGATPPPSPSDFDPVQAAILRTRGATAATATVPQAAPPGMPQGNIQEAAGASQGASWPTPKATPSSPLEILLRAQAAPAAGAPQGPAMTPGGGDFAQSMRTVQSVLQGQADRLAEAAQSAFPSDRRGWSAAMADTLGVQHDPMMSLLMDKAAKSNPELHQLLQAHGTIPRAVMAAITDAMADARDAGLIPRVQNAPGGANTAPGASVASLSLGEQMRLASYQASIRQAEAAANAVRQQAPAAVAAIEAESTVKAKQAALHRYLRGIADPAARAKQAAILTPLTLFGSKADPEVSPAATAAPGVAQAWILPGLPMNATNDNRN